MSFEWDSFACPSGYIWAPSKLLSIPHLVAARHINLEELLDIVYIEDQPDQELHKALFHTFKKWISLHLQEKKRMQVELLPNFWREVNLPLVYQQYQVPIHLELLLSHSPWQVILFWITSLESRFSLSINRLCFINKTIAEIYEGAVMNRYVYLIVCFIFNLLLWTYPFPSYNYPF